MPQKEDDILKVNIFSKFLKYDDNEFARMLVEQGGFIKLEVAYIMHLIEKYEDYEEEMNDINNDMDDFPKKERKQMKNKSQLLEKKLKNIKNIVQSKWDIFTKLELHDQCRIIDVAQDDVYYMICIFRIQRTVQEWDEQSD